MKKKTQPNKVKLADIELKSFITEPKQKSLVGGEFTNASGGGLKYGCVITESIFCE